MKQSIINKLWQDESFQFSIILTFLFFGIGITFLFLGLATYSWVLFILLPILLGIALGALPNRKNVRIGSIITAILFLILLIPFGLSGAICALMCLPIVIPFMFLGSVITFLAKRYKEITTNRLPVLFLPLIPFLVIAPIEKKVINNGEEIIQVTSEKIYDFTPEQVFDTIKSVDTLDTDKPWLMYLDLPIPTKCILEKEEVGAKRTCYFDSGNFSSYDFGSGIIEEQVTEIERGKILKMDVIDYKLVGRNWLGFKEAIYYFNKVGDSKCKLTRITTYTSILTPRIYWEPLERLGIEQEHEYVLRNLLKDLNNKYLKK